MKSITAKDEITEQHSADEVGLIGQEVVRLMLKLMIQSL